MGAPEERGKPFMTLPGSLPVGPVSSLELVTMRARALPTRIVVIAGAQDAVALEAAAMAEEQGLARCVLVGDQHKIEAILWDMGRDPRDFQIVSRQELHESIVTAVELVRNGEGHILMKGKVTTGDLLSEVLHRERGLRTGRILSDVFLFDSPLPGEARLMGITDGGINLAPDLGAKAQILRNALDVFWALDYEKPRVAVLSAIEKVNPDLPSTLDARELARMALRGEFGSCEVDGPLAMDLALSPESARQKGVTSSVAGLADILLFPNIESANITAKAIQYMVPFEPGHVVVGAQAPVLIPSRSESAEAKVNAVALRRLMVPTGR
jgi:phosphate butyryltransferase